MTFLLYEPYSPEDYNTNRNKDNTANKTAIDRDADRQKHEK